METTPRQPDETLYAFCQRRERELLHQISALKTQLSAKEDELAHVQSAVRQIGNLGGDNAFPEARERREARLKVELAEPKATTPIPAIPATRTTNALASFRIPTIEPGALEALRKIATMEPSVVEALRKATAIEPSALEAMRKAAASFSSVGDAFQQAMRRGALGIPPLPPAEMTIKQLILRALSEHFQPKGATAAELREYVQNAYGRTITHASISPQLSRLKAEGQLLHDEEADSWKLGVFLMTGKILVPTRKKISSGDTQDTEAV